MHQALLSHGHYLGPMWTLYGSHMGICVIYGLYAVGIQAELLVHCIIII